MSKWIADKVTSALEASWPPEFLALGGAFPDFPETNELRKGYGEDAARESTDDAP